DVPPPLSSGSPARVAAGAPGAAPSALEFAALKDARAAFEREFITRKLKDHGGNVSRTADAIGVERSNLHRKMKTLGIETDF
ncbi:MAG TPA: Fis family transcriptional regulator, partial [Nitrospiraceae bacterium]|nr:Fis family transcriptional regulator [Nitrospiraceae bacterium]